MEEADQPSRTHPAALSGLRLPVIAAPMFIVSGPALVVAQCKAGIVGSMPALNGRTTAQFDEALHEIQEELHAWNTANPATPAAPFAVNQIVFRTNDRLDADMEICERRRVPIVISSLGAREDVNQHVHRWGGIVLHDVINDCFARKAIEKGADGLVAVAAGAGGHAGSWSPFALVAEIRQWFNGPLALSGAIATGAGILAAQAMGADFAYIGSPFIATDEAQAPDAYRQAILAGSAADIVYTPFFTGVHGNYLRPAITAAGLDPDRLPARGDGPTKFAQEAKPWKDIWAAGQGIGAVHEIVPAAALIGRLSREYQAARHSLNANPQEA